MTTPARIAAVIGLLIFANATARAQPARTSGGAPDAVLTAASAAERSTEPATLTFANRPVVVLRARVLGRQPADRAAGAQRILDDLVEQRITGPVESRDFAQGSVILVGSRAVFVLTMPDVDDLAGETLASVRDEAVLHLRQALADAYEARSPRILLTEVSLTLVALLLASLALWALALVRRRASTRLIAAAERRLARAGIVDVEDLRASRLLEFERAVVTAVTAGVGLVIVYATVMFVLRRFP